MENLARTGSFSTVGKAVLDDDPFPSFEILKDTLEVQEDPLLGFGAFGTVHYAVLIAEHRTVALKAISKARTHPSSCFSPYTPCRLHCIFLIALN